MKRKTIDGEKWVMISEKEFLEICGKTIGSNVWDFIHNDEVGAQGDPIVAMGIGMFATNVTCDLARKLFKDKKGE